MANRKVGQCLVYQLIFGTIGSVIGVCVVYMAVRTFFYYPSRDDVCGLFEGLFLGPLAGGLPAIWITAKLIRNFKGLNIFGSIVAGAIYLIAPYVGAAISSVLLLFVLYLMYPIACLFLTLVVAACFNFFIRDTGILSQKKQEPDNNAALQGLEEKKNG
ncbi:MAG: hypothetical protein HZA50_03510 [Planctomycetes bacterium]|nr:hypothetical protein [Planctomycetota bacterium]